ncbi:phytanoyl-CoA dioxygenase [Paenibacillus montanisoli]|uniref:Phytanoyl-CoA dioxygenase n=2 Tax=Paenibacillus montanisoli TaxID=2081970 RepID=A0A328U2A2_9BACL|nr:phytanoyl-CoA dioxygenase [Paenibacillus montanisoli]
MVKIGKHAFEMGSKYLTELRESNDILDDAEALRARMDEDGYLLIRGFHDKETVKRARIELLQDLEKQGKLDASAPLEEAVINKHHDGRFTFQDNEHTPMLLELVNSDRTMAFFDRFLGGESMTFDFKWPRVVDHGRFTGAHYDVVYMGQGTKNLFTLWTPLGDVSYEMGGICLCLGSQHFDAIKRTYGQMDVDRDNIEGDFSRNPLELVEKYGGRWATTEFQSGDALIFGMYMMHASLTNTSDRYRLSVDTRYQLRSEAIDDRWVGKKPKGHYAWGKSAPPKAMAEARKEWNI